MKGSTPKQRAKALKVHRAKIVRKNLFDTRGGLAMIGRCEECNNQIPEDSASGLCPSCEAEWEVCDDES